MRRRLTARTKNGPMWASAPTSGRIQVGRGQGSPIRSKERGTAGDRKGRPYAAENGSSWTPTPTEESGSPRRILCAVLAALLAVLLCGCGVNGGRAESSAPTKENKPIRVVCTLFPYYDFARAIGGDDAEVTLLVAAGKEAHSFEPTPLDVIRLSKADVFLYNGGESEKWVEDILDAAGESIKVTAAMMDLVDPEEEEFVEGMQVGEHDEDGEEEEIEYDEHIWTSPLLVMDICRGICDALCQADPEHTENYEVRLTAYLGALEELDAAFREVAEEAAHRTLLFGDRFPLLYFAKTYGFDYRAAFHGCASDTEPSLATLKYLIDKVNTEKIPAIYTIELSNRKIAQAIAETTGAKILTFQSCQTVSREDFENGETYLSLMERNVEALREGTK